MMANGKRIAWSGLALAATGAGLAMLIGYGADARADQVRAQGRVVLMRCSTGSSESTVLAYQKSNEAPVKRSNNCAQALGDILKDGYRIQHSEISVDADQIVYTLIR